ncbi:MAG: DUF1552 domain-containing protein [Myxococcota bacterium]
MTWTRRQALRTAASTLWLPFLPSILPREARAATGEAPRRLIVWFLPHGMQHVHVAPEGGALETTTVTEPIATLPGRISVVTNLNNSSGGGSHGRSTASLLTDIPGPYGVAEAGISVDQLAAGEYALDVPFPSIQLGTEAPGLFGSSGEGILVSRISWANATTPLAPITSPQAAFDQLFEGQDNSLSESEAARRRALRHSVLDAVKDRISSLEPKLSTPDRHRLDQYTTGIRELERRIDGLGELQCEPPIRPGLNPNYVETVELMAELQYIAMSCDLTRVATFMYGPSASDITLPDLSINQGSHQLSHAWSYDDGANGDFQAMNQWHVAQFVAFCERLAEHEDQDGTDMLANTAVVLGSEFSDASAHTSDQLCMLVAGGEAGGFRPGRHVNGGGQPHANLLRSLLTHMNVNWSGFGQNGTGVLGL